MGVLRRGASALLLSAPPEPRHQAAQPAPDFLAGVSGDLAGRVVGLDDPQLVVGRALGPASGDCLGGLRAVARAAGLGGFDLRPQAGDMVVGIRRGKGCVGVVGHGTYSSTYHVGRVRGLARRAAARSGICGRAQTQAPNPTRFSPRSTITSGVGAEYRPADLGLPLVRVVGVKEADQVVL